MTTAPIPVLSKPGTTKPPEKKPAGPPATWRPLTLADAMQPRSPMQYRLDPWFPEGSVNLWFGPGASHKSNVLADAAMMVACGARWLGRFETRKAPVLWLNADNATPTILSRLGAFARAYEVDQATAFYLLSFPEPALDLTKSSSVQHLHDFVAAHGIGLVILDPLQALKGRADENAATEVGPAIANLRRVAEATSAAFVIVHHVNKQGQQRGSTALRDLVDSSVSVERSENRVTLKPDKVRHADIEPIALDWHFEHVPSTRELARCWFTAAEVDGPEGEIADWVREYLSENPNRTGRAIKAAGVEQGFPRNEIDRTLTKMDGRGIVRTAGPRNSWVWNLECPAVSRECPGDSRE